MKLPGQVLIIDDDQDDLALMGEALEKIGIRSSCEFFSSAREALERIRNDERQPYLILCDLNLSGMSALEFKAVLNGDARQGQQAIPFVIFTGHADDDEVRSAIALKSQGCFIKPIAFDEMVLVLETILTYWDKCMFYK